ncbi:MAG: hypothetical protein GY865_16365 [candidate division Zixibacteria bacterium]|nr:hypothetical protein [candidate division Zixibacteria bacterium]
MRKFITILTVLILGLAASNIYGQELEISGFLDVVGNYNTSSDDKTDFSMNHVEIAFKKQLSKNANGTIVTAYNQSDGSFKLAVAEIAIGLYKNDKNFVNWVGVYAGKFDVPFGIDYMVNPAPKRKLVSRPNVVSLTHGNWGDYGTRFQAKSQYGNFVVFWVNGFESSYTVSDAAHALTLSLSIGDEVNTTPANAFGGRIGITPIPDLEIGSSWATGINESNQSEMILFGGDFQYNWQDKLNLKGEYINHSLNRSIEMETNKGYYFQSSYSFGKTFLVGRYGSFQADGAEWVNRVSAGAGWDVSETIELRFETTINKDSANNTNVFQLVAEF